MTAVATGLIGVAATVWQVAVLRALAWVSRGLRSPARDTMLVALVDRSAYGRASGVERAGDNVGALIGPLVAAALVGMIGIRHTLVLAFVPGLFAAGTITIAAREAGRSLSADGAPRRLSFNLRELYDAGLARTLVAPALFELGNLATTLLILRSTDVLHTGGRSATAAASLAILLYAGHNAAAALSALGSGAWIDRVGPRTAFCFGGIVYVLAYAIFAVESPTAGLCAAAFVLAGIGIGCAETAESTMVALALPDELRGNGFGLLGLVQSLGDLGATLVAGLLWATTSPSIAFGYAACWMALSAACSWLIRPRPTSPDPGPTPVLIPPDPTAGGGRP